MRYSVLLIAAVGMTFLVVLLSHLRVESYSAYTRDLSTITDKEHNVAIVFGSAVDDIAKEPRPVVRDRLLAALELYDNGAVDRIVVSGYEDEINQDYNEPDVMRRFLVAQGVNTTDITEDNQGDSSYDTCKNVKQELSINRAVLVTQPTHMSRALYLCRNMNIDAVGYTAEQTPSRRWLITQTTREAFGNVKAVFDIHVRYSFFDGR